MVRKVWNWNPLRVVLFCHRLGTDAAATASLLKKNVRCVYKRKKGRHDKEMIDVMG